MGNDLGKVHGNAANFHTDVLPLVLDLRDQLRRVQQTLGWNAAYVQAGAAQMLPFDEGDLRTQLGRPDGSYIAAGTSAHHDHTLEIRGRSRRSSSSRCGCDALPSLTDIGENALYRDVVPLLGHDF